MFSKNPKTAINKVFSADKPVTFLYPFVNLLCTKLHRILNVLKRLKEGIQRLFSFVINNSRDMLVPLELSLPFEIPMASPVFQNTLFPFLITYIFAVFRAPFLTVSR